MSMDKVLKPLSWHSSAITDCCPQADYTAFVAFKNGALWILKELLSDKVGTDPVLFHHIMKVATAKLQCTEKELLLEMRYAAPE